MYCIKYILIIKNSDTTFLNNIFDTGVFIICSSAGSWYRQLFWTYCNPPLAESLAE